jgi:hypothetical protein
VLLIFWVSHGPTEAEWTGWTELAGRRALIGTPSNRVAYRFSLNRYAGKAG